MPNATGEGGFQTTVTVFVTLGGQEVPWTARQETGGVTAPTYPLGFGVFTFSPDYFISPGASEPPPGL